MDEQIENRWRERGEKEGEWKRKKRRQWEGINESVDGWMGWIPDKWILG